MDIEARQSGEATQARAERLKERVYITFAALAVVLALEPHSADLSAGEVATTLSITVVGAALAVFVADLVSHLVVHAAVPTRPEVRHMVRVSGGALSALVLPFVFVAVAGRGWLSVEGALRASTIALVASLGAVGYLAVRRVQLPWWQRGVALLAEFALGAAVVGLQVLAHSL